MNDNHENRRQTTRRHTRPQHRPRWRAWWLAAAIAALGTLAGCGGGDPVEQEHDAPMTPQAQGNQPDCVFEGYPCAWKEVARPLIERSAELGAAVEARLSNGQTTAQAVAWLRQQEPQVVLQHDDIVIRFRIPGARPVWVMTPDGGFDTSEQAPEAQLAPRSMALKAPAEPKKQTRSVVATGSESKSALILSPFRFENLSVVGERVKAELLQTRGYAGRVTYKENAVESARNVGVSDFDRFNDHDVIVVDTHGARLCKNLETGEPINPCKGLLTAQLVTDKVVDSVEAGNVGVELFYYQGLPRLGLSADFFREMYPQGVTNKLLYISACHSADVDIALALHGTNSVYVGWERRVGVYHANDVARAVFEELAFGWSVSEVLEVILGKSHTKDYLRNSELLTNGRDIRVRELPDAIDGYSQKPLTNGGPIEVTGTPGDGQADSLLLEVLVDGVDGELLRRYLLQISVDGVARQSLDLTSAEQVDDHGRWRVMVEVPLGKDVQPGQTLTLRFDVSLPERGLSTWTVQPVVRDLSALPSGWFMEVTAESAGLFSQSLKTSHVEWRLKPNQDPRSDRRYYEAKSLVVTWQNWFEFRVGYLVCSGPGFAVVQIPPTAQMTLWFDVTTQPMRYYSWSARAPEQQVEVQVTCDDRTEVVRVGLGGLLWMTNFDEAYPFVEYNEDGLVAGEFVVNSGLPTTYRWTLEAVD